MDSGFIGVLVPAREPWKNHTYLFMDKLYVLNLVYTAVYTRRTKFSTRVLEVPGRLRIHISAPLGLIPTYIILELP